MRKYVLAFASLLSVSALVASETDSEIFAARGAGEVSHAEFDAHMAHIPERDRAAFLRDPKRLETVVSSLLLREQLAAVAREMGFDQSEMMQHRMALAAQNELADAWLEHYIEVQGEPDTEAMAREYYMLNSQEFMSELQVDVSHILISKESRPEEEALEMALAVSMEAREDPGSFDDLIIERSEDPSVAQNRGHFTNVNKGDMVKAFEDAAFSQAPGEISDPILTPYGYHIVRVDKVHEPRAMTFDEVRGPLEKQQLARHRERVRNGYLGQLANQEVKMTEEALKKMLSRYFDPEALADSTEPESE